MRTLARCGPNSSHPQFERRADPSAAPGSGNRKPLVFGAQLVIARLGFTVSLIDEKSFQVWTWSALCLSALRAIFRKEKPGGGLICRNARRIARKPVASLIKGDGKHYSWTGRQYDDTGTNSAIG
jgi:hypothetical protein